MSGAERRGGLPCVGACSPPGNASSTERGRLASCPSSPSLVSLSLFADYTVRADGVTHRSIGTAEGRELQFAASLGLLSIVTAIRAHVIDSGACTRTVATSWYQKQGHVLLAVIKPHACHTCTSFCVQSKVKRFKNAKVNNKYN